MSSDGYLLDNRRIEAGARIDALSALFNPSTLRHIEDIGIERGWRCWEVGAGGPTVPAWLAERVGPGGHVLATDIDVTQVQNAAGPTLEVLRHDIGNDEPPASGFDLVHARLVLVHVSNRDKALQSMVKALRPGGWLLLEDADPALQPLGCLEVRASEQRLANKLRGAFRVLLSEREVDLEYGRKLPRLLREAGLSDVGADAYFPVSLPACNQLEEATINLLREALLARGLTTVDELDSHLANIEAGRLDLVTSPMISAWGRRP